MNSFVMSKENQKNLFLVLYILAVVLLTSWFFYGRLKNSIQGAIDSLNPTADIGVETGYVGSGIELLTGIDLQLSDIDKMNGILDIGTAGQDFSIIKPNPQTMKYSSTVEDDFKSYLANNIYTVTVPEDIKGGYLYIKLHKPLRYMSNIGAYQPITIKTNIYVSGRGVHGRLNTKASLGTYTEAQDFLYKLSNVPVKTAKHDSASWLDMAGKQIQIGGFVSDTNGNYIENIVFIWER